MNTILFGFKGCGKTHFGQLLAQTLQRPFIDTDDSIRQIYAEKTEKNLTLPAIYQIEGETGFRVLEAQAIQALLNVKNSVIALGGGAILNPKNLEVLQKMGLLIYLEISLETIKKRQTHFLVGSIEELYRRRIPLYQAISAPCVNTDLLDEKGVLAALCALIYTQESSHVF